MLCSSLSVVTSFVRSWLPRAGRWLAPSAAAACASALAAAIVDGFDGAGPFDLAVGAGFIAIVVVPVLVAAAAIARGLFAAWRPREFAAAIVSPSGGAPRLAAWLCVIAIDALALAALAFAGTRWIASKSEFLPLEVSWFEAAVVAAGGLVLLALSRPMARAIGALTIRIDRRWPRALRPRVQLGALAALALALATALWIAFVKPAIGPLDTSIFHAPVAAVAVALAMHAAWPRLGRARTAIAGALVGACAVLAALALIAEHAYPTTTLEVWGDRPFAGFAIDTAFDVDDIRASVPLDEFRPVERPGAAHPDIILVTIDTVRADHTPPYGGHATMPVLAGLAEHGTVFEHAYSPSNVTRRSIPSMIIGLPADRVHGRVVGWALRVDPRHVLLAERLRAGGYETAGFMCCAGFWGADAHTGLQRGLEHVEIEQNGLELAKRARRWLDARSHLPGRRPLFLWIHILEPHNWPALAGEPRTDEERTRFYDRIVSECDGMLGEVLEPFATKPIDGQPIVVVTADHGEGLGEHGHPYHSTDLYNSQIHIPLVIAGPGVLHQRVASAVSTTDLVPTLLDLAGFQPPSRTTVDGDSFADLATGKRQTLPDGGIAFAAMIKDRSNPGGVTALVKGTWKLVDDGARLELYNLATDPDEHHDLAATRLDKRDELLVLLRAKQALAKVSPFP